MDKQQFETAFGQEVSQDTFNYAEQIWLAAGDRTRAEVIAELKKDAYLFNSPLLRAIVTREREMEKKAARVDDLAAVLLTAALAADDEDTWNKVSDVLGDAEVIRYKVDNQWDLTARDRAYILENIK